MSRPRPGEGTKRKHPQLPFSKVCTLEGDAPALAEAYRVMDQYPGILEGQHPIRAWEYAMAYRAIQEWQGQEPVEGRDDLGNPIPASLGDPLRIADVGGAGSNFWQLLTAITSEDLVLIDTALTWDAPRGQAHPFPQTVEQFAATMAHGQFDVMTCISVIEHVEEVGRFLRACAMLLRTGGLLFLTTDFWDAEGEDLAHFHWMRKRIYNADRMRRLQSLGREVGFRSFGEADWTYHGPQLYDYTMASCAMVRK